jgi:SAM-dependent methyltransferase
MGIVARATAFDCSQELLRQAAAAREQRPIAYFQGDCNRLELQPDSFDLVVNVAAMHHVQFVDRMCRLLCRVLRPDGVFVSFDYVGPRRNQYSWLHWLRIRRANLSLPADLRRPRLRHPHLPTMMAVDPTEAIHSNLTLPTAARYFDIVERHDAGGGLAYELLSHNPRLGEVPADRLQPHVGRLLELDRQATAAGKVPPLFSYFICRPKKAVLDDDARLAEWERDEHRREHWAARHRGVYGWSEYVRLRVQQYIGQRLVPALTGWRKRLL